MERNKKAFDFVPVDPAEIARTALDAVRDRFEQDGFRLECEIAPDLPEIVADSDALVTVLLNLLDNAHKYSPEDKHVRLGVVRRGEHVCFEVSDRGIGMTGRAARRAFDRFYQADQRLARRAGGCGLGLSIVKFVVDAHAGSVEVSSRPGQGSTFTVKIPCAGTPAAKKLGEGAA
jgi:two-component system phosphate regulon sensor histidine kinase PhoR